MAIEIQITTGGTVPIYRQIMDQVRRGIAGRTLETGDQLPSVRALAERLLVNHNTVAKAYNELVRDGVIESRHGKGVFIAANRQVYTKAEQKRRLEQALDSFISEALLLQLSHDEIREAFDRRLRELNGGSPQAKDK